MANYASIEYQIIRPVVPADTPFVQSMIIFGSPKTITETPVDTRSIVNEFSTYFQTVIGVTSRLREAITADYVSGDVESLPLVATGGGDRLVITATAYGVVITPAIAEWLIVRSNTAESPPSAAFEITNITVQAADVANRNTHCRFNISVANGASPYEITSPESKTNQTEPLFFDYLRNPPLPLVETALEDSNFDVANITTPSVDFFTLTGVTVNEGQASATVIANISVATPSNPSFHYTSIREYSLDNATWRTSETFVGITPGSYTMYVRDNYGALYTYAFDVVGVSEYKPTPFLKIEKSNPLRFVPHVQTVDLLNKFDCSNIANLDNALFSELFEQNVFMNVQQRSFSQLITDCDNVVTQVKSNYDNLVVTLTDCDNTETIISNTKVTENLNKIDKRDCSLIGISSSDPDLTGKTLVYFTGGDIYNSETDLVIGDYPSTTKLFNFAKVGTLFTISGTSNLNGSFTQLGAFYDIDTGFWGVLLDVPFNNSFGLRNPITAIIEIKYSELNYDVYEFTLSGITLSENQYQIKVEATDDSVDYPDVIWMSEPIKKINSTKGTTSFDYKHTSNAAGLDFSTNAVFRLRLSGRFADNKNNEDSVDFKSDRGQKVVLKTNITRNTNFESDLIPFYQAEKLAIASGLDTLLINGISYVRGEEEEANSYIEERNPFFAVIRDYQLNDTISIEPSTGLVVSNNQVIGESDNIVIGV